ncbi:MAG: DUF4397 domain-containing protein [Rhizobacter sp.]
MNKAFKLLLVCAPVLLVAACGGDDNLDDRLDIADPKVRLVHAIPAGPNVSLFRDNVAQSAAVTNVPYAGASNYFDVSTSSATWSVRTTVGGVELGKSLFEATRGNKFTLIAVPGANSATEVLNIVDPYNKELSSKDGRVRVLNAAYNQVTLDAYVYEQNIDISGTTVTPNFPAVAYRAAYPASGNDSVEIAAGNKAYYLTLTAAGSKTPVFRAPLTVADNVDWLVVVLPDRVLLVSSDSSSPAVELANTLL